MTNHQSSIISNLEDVRQHIPSSVTLVCVSKFQPEQAIREAYEAGERHFGESRVQELQRKAAQLPADICWHFIGHLQTNKVRDLLKLRPYLIQSVDSVRLLQAINDEATKQGFVQDVLLEVHVAREETKTGFSPEELKELMANGQWRMANVRVRGLMTMATNTDDETEIRRCFTEAKALHDQMANGQMANDQMLHLSMGMSDDYRIAIECGATMVRIGSTIFGERAATNTQKLKAVFFDQDGVLFNSMPFHAKAWYLAMQEAGLPWQPQEAYVQEGRTGADVIQELYKHLHGVEAPRELIERTYTSKSNHFLRLTGGKQPDLIDGVYNLIQWLHAHGVQCWVVTGSGQRSLLDNLQNTFNHVFSGIITAYDVTHGKPNPEPYLKAWERSGFQKEECMVVENAPLGVRAGKAAGLFTCAVNTGPLADKILANEGADKVFPNMAALLDWIQHKV